MEFTWRGNRCRRKKTFKSRSCNECRPQKGLRVKGQSVRVGAGWPQKVWSGRLSEEVALTESWVKCERKPGEGWAGGLTEGPAGVGAPRAGVGTSLSVHWSSSEYKCQSVKGAVSCSWHLRCSVTSVCRYWVASCWECSTKWYDSSLLG